MPGLRIMTYNVRRFSCHRDGLTAVQEVIAASAPDIVALQEIDADNSDDLQILAQRLGMRFYVAPGRCGNAFLSYYPLHHLQSFSLSDAGCCLRAELDFGQKRLHFYNVRIDGARQHKEQIDSLLGEDLLGAQHLGVPALILGDFGVVVSTGIYCWRCGVSPSRWCMAPILPGCLCWRGIALMFSATSAFSP